MLHIQYIGLLNTDRVRHGPVQMFLQARESRRRYVLDRLPTWIDTSCMQTQSRGTDRRYIPGTNLDLLDQETREAFYHSLVAGGYKVCQIRGGFGYRAVHEVFAP